MQNLIPHISDIGLPVSIPVPAILFKSGKDFSIILYDILGTMVDIIEVEHDVPRINNQLIREEKLYFVEVIFYDVFYKILKLHSIIDINQPVGDFIRQGICRDKNFMKHLFHDCKNAHKLTELN